YTELNPHQEPVQLRFGQRKCPDLVLWILSRDHKKRLWQRVSGAVGRNMILFHRLQQRALSLCRGPIHFINQNHLRKKWPLMKNESLLFTIENRIAKNIGGEQIAGELNPLKPQAERAGECVR